MNGGASNGIQCFKLAANGLTVISTAAVDFGFKLTTPPSNGPAQVSFTMDGKGLIVSLKLFNATANQSPLMRFSFDSAALTIGKTPAVTSTQGKVPFGFTFDGTDGSIVITDAAPFIDNNDGGVQLVTVSTTAITFALSSYVRLNNQAAACWAIWSPTTKNFYIANAGSNTITLVTRNGNALNAGTSFNVTGKPLDLAIATVAGTDYLFGVVGTTVSSYKLGASSFTPLASAQASSTSFGVAVFVQKTPDMDSSSGSSLSLFYCFILLGLFFSL